MTRRAEVSTDLGLLDQNPLNNSHRVGIGNARSVVGDFKNDFRWIAAKIDADIGYFII
jgi:hypothetical protein